jgi:hypothetical protein
MQNAVERQHARPPLKPLRSGEMVSCLRENYLYSEKRARDILFGAIQKAVAMAGDSPLMLCSLTREAAKGARDDANAAGYKFSNWEITAKAVIGAMLGAGVFVTHDGLPVPVGIAAQATPIGGLKKGYQVLTEAFLIEFLIRKLGDVTTRDHRALAHALFRQFDLSISMDYFEDRVAMLVATLADRVILSEAGVYSIRETK